jgi:magnesium-transporting ATPase (P-type)
LFFIIFVLKVTSLERRLDQFIVVMFAMLLVMCVASAVANGALQSQALTFAYLQPFDRSPAVSGVISFFTYLILYSGIVPLPLYVSLEAVNKRRKCFAFFNMVIWKVKVAQAVLIGWDVDMCSDGLATKARSSLSDELGRVDTLFTDKTGTLTRNEMVFRRFCLRDGVVRSLDELQGSQEENGEAELWRALALCHSASLGVDGTWHGESPDEIALLKGLAKVRPQRAFSIEEQDKEGGRVIVLASGEKYKLLDTVVFSSERKMMSVLVSVVVLVMLCRITCFFQVQRESDGAEIVYTKGAEQAVMQCCSLQEDAVNSVVRNEVLLPMIVLKGGIVCFFFLFQDLWSYGACTRWLAHSCCGTAPIAAWGK